MKRIKSLLLYLVTLLLFTLLGESYLRVTDLCQANIYLPHPSFGALMAPNIGFREFKELNIHRTTNNLGFVDSSHEVVATDGTRRILFLGNSFVQAIQVRELERFSKLVESKLNADGSVGAWESINMGLAGAGTGVEYLIYEELGRQFKPDLVVIGITVNDTKVNMNNSGGPTFFINGDGEVEADLSFVKSFMYRYSVLTAPLKSRSALFTWFTKCTRRMLQEPVLPIFLGKLAPKSSKKKKKTSVDDTLPDPVEFQKTLDKEMKVFTGILREMNDKIDKEGSSLFIVFFPRPIGIRSPFDSEEPSAVDFFTRRERLLAEIDRLQIPVLDMTPDFRRHLEETGQDVSWWPKTQIYGHFDVTGHEITAERIASWVKDNFSP